MSFNEGLVINNSITIRDRLNLTEFKDIHKHLEGEYTEYTLQLLHYGDLDSGDNNVFNNIASFSSLVKKYRDLYPLNTLLVSSGDNYITGPRLFASESESFQSFYQSKNPNFK